MRVACPIPDIFYQITNPPVDGAGERETCDGEEEFAVLPASSEAADGADSRQLHLLPELPSHQTAHLKLAAGVSQPAHHQSVALHKVRKCLCYSLPLLRRMAWTLEASKF